MEQNLALIPPWTNFKLAFLPGLSDRFSRQAVGFLEAEAGLAVALSMYRATFSFPIVATPFDILDLSSFHTSPTEDLSLGVSEMLDAPTLRFMIQCLVSFVLCPLFFLVLT